MSIHEIESKIKELRNLQALIEEATAEAEASMGDSEELRAGEYKVTWKPVKAVRIDTKALQAALPEVAQRFAKENTTRRFVIA